MNIHPQRIKDQIAKEVFKLSGDRPNLAIIFVGEDKATKDFLEQLESESKKVGIDTHLYTCEEEMNEDEILKVTEYLNNDDIIDAVLLAEPLPSHYDIQLITDSIIESKFLENPNSQEGEEMDIAQILYSSFEKFMESKN